MIKLVPGEIQARTMLERVLDELATGLSITRRDGAIAYANKAAIELVSRQAGNGAIRPAEAIDTQAPTVSTLRQPVVLDGEVFEVVLSSDITEQQRREDELFKRAYFDELTGLPNRVLMERAVHNLIGSANDGTCFALAFIDIDNFKHINDYYGHDVGDGLLVKIADRIGSVIRETDMLARVGGDELLLLLSPITSIERMQDAARRVLERLKEPFFIEGHEIFSSASIGVSLFPLHGQTYSVLRANADSAMYRIKTSGKGGIKVFDPDIGQAVSERMKLEQRLRMAIRDRRLCCAFQPKVDFRDDKVTGVEVLLRWRDEEGVIQAPGDFVDLAVELGLMDDITLQVLDETIRSLDRINQSFGPCASISINVAAKQANDIRFMRSFADALAATGDPARFMVELTEEAFLEKTQFQTRVLPLLRDIGARVSIDDFGVGFSSLSALADITADEIKVDRSFIQGIHKRPRNQSILSAIESLGQALSMSVIVEGVETFEELAYLQAATRIRLAQGYYFSKPIHFDDVVGGAYAPQRLLMPARDRTGSREWRQRA